MEDSQQSKTQAATPRRREQAKDEGQTVFSPGLAAGLTLGLTCLLCVMCWQSGWQSASASLRETLSNLRMRDWGVVETVLAGRWVGGHLIVLAGLLFAFTVPVAVVGTHFQSGLTLTWKPLTPNWSKLSPAAGWQRLFSLDSLMRGVLAVLQLAGSLGVAVCVFRGFVQLFRSQHIIDLAPLVWLLIGLSAVTLVCGAVDYAFRWWRHEQKLRMSTQELKDEQKADQGDPQVRAQMRRMQQQRAKQQKMLDDVPTATMVITNPTHYAVALRYQTGRDAAPQIVAKGVDGFAQRIIEAAKLNGVPVFERKPLTRALFALADVGEEIPFEFYRAIAELLAHVYRLKRAA